MMKGPLASLSDNLARLATHYDMTGEWPAHSIELLTSAGAWTWVIPKVFGGLQLPPELQVAAYEAIAAGSMAAVLILTQRDGACELIAASENEQLKIELLPKLLTHEAMTSVGISQLTTSRQGEKPALVAEPQGDGFVLKGFMPWVTGAEKCDFFVTGAVLPDHRQILAIVPANLPGMIIDPPMQLMALQSSRTSEVHCRDVQLDRKYILRGPVEKALESRSPVKSLVVAATGVGLAGAMMRAILRHSEDAGKDLKTLAEDLYARYDAIRERLYRLAADLNKPDVEIPKTEFRIAVNDLLVRMAAGVLTFGKGSAFIRQREDQRLVREAMFFLVWSAPEEVRTRTLAGLLETPDGEIKSMRT